MIGTLNKCLRCQHEWHSRVPGRPERCANPRCRTAVWDEPYRVVFSHYCEACHTNWFGSKADPLRCARCKSIHWREKR